MVSYNCSKGTTPRKGTATMSKKEFIRKYRALTAAEKADVKAHWEDVYKHSHFVESLNRAETVLLWIREADNK